MPSEITPFSSPIPSPEPTENLTPSTPKKLDIAEKALSGQREALKEARAEDKMLDKRKKSPAKPGPLAKLGLEKLDMAKLPTEKKRDSDVDRALARLSQEYAKLPTDKQNGSVTQKAQDLLGQGAFKKIYRAQSGLIPVAMAVSTFKKW
ncbi:MAG: hypothetical protein LLG04_01085, partial [Parachlamydia sp.]|nr:hypothetical protein [Parachlamydia sp.]